MFKKILAVLSVWAVSACAINIGESFSLYKTISESTLYDTLSGTSSDTLTSFIIPTNEPHGKMALVRDAISGTGSDSVLVQVVSDAYDKLGNLIYSVAVDTFSSASGEKVDIPELPGYSNQIRLVGLTGNGSQVILNRIYIYRYK